MTTTPDAQEKAVPAANAPRKGPGKRRAARPDGSPHAAAGADAPAAGPQKPRKQRGQERKIMDVRSIAQTARAAIEDLTGHPFDAVSRCERRETAWLVEADVIESRARMGDDDLLTAYELELSLEGDVIAFRRLRRHQRSESGAAVSG